VRAQRANVSVLQKDAGDISSGELAVGGLGAAGGTGRSRDLAGKAEMWGNKKVV
jgi:hypothetical protein